MSIVNSFELLKEYDIPEINTKARYYQHAPTGARLLSLENDDENKVFGITFRTPPYDSTGVAHIMEHAVLCGSRKYPVKEPYVELMKGSLNTFLNAMTFPDKTCYPVASQNLQDFYNLIDVYMDAVLHPLIPPRTLQQEGWHYEPDSLDGPLSYKGVVFNEMKGVYSDPDDLLDEETRHSLFPDNLYRFDYGGNPLHIPDLTYEQFKVFHDRYYHPSNARIFFYGNDDPAERLRRMEEYLQDYQAIQIESGVPLQEPFDQPRRHVISFDPGEQQGKGRLVINWLMSEAADAQMSLALQILNHILIGTPASPLRKALIDSGLGEDLAGKGLERDLRQMYFSTGLKGLVVGDDNHPLHGDKVEALIWDTLKSLVKDGIDPDQVAASLNTIEFRLRENNTGSFPRGLSLMFRSLMVWLYDGDPVAPLAFEAPLAAIKQRLAHGERLFEDLIQKHFLNNPHHTVLVVQPEPGRSQHQDEAERQELAQIKASLSKEKLEAILDSTRWLKQYQETPDSPEALATIPSLALSDLDKQNKRIPLEVSEHAGCQVLTHDLFTNGILYLDVGFNLHTLPQALLPYVPLFGRALLEIGTQTEDFVKLSQRIGRFTGGIRPTTFNSVIQGTQKGASWLFLRGKATLHQADDLLAILRDVLLTVRLDNQERFRQMALEEKASTEAALVQMGHRVVDRRLRAMFDEAGWAEEQMYGADNLFFLRRLVEKIDKDWPSVLTSLETMRRLLVSRPGMLCNVTVDQASWSQLQPKLASFLDSLPSTASPLVAWQPGVRAGFEGLTLPAQVNFVGKGASLYRLGYRPDGSIDVVQNYLRATWLWEKVRVQGGAYGGFCAFSQHSGILTYLSYRDPNLLGTLDNYDGVGGFLRQLDLSQAELTKSIIGAIGDLDAYQFPDAKGYTSMARYLAGETEQQLQEWREQILGATVEDFHHLGEVLEKVKEAGQVVVLGSPEAIQEANEVRQGWLQVHKVL